MNITILNKMTKMKEEVKDKRYINLVVCKKPALLVPAKAKDFCSLV